MALVGTEVLYVSPLRFDGTLSPVTEQTTAQAVANLAANSPAVAANTANIATNAANIATNATAISTETTARTNADNSEATLRINGDSANTTAINAEVTRAEAAEALLAPKASPTFTGLVTAAAINGTGLTIAGTGATDQGTAWTAYTPTVTASTGTFTTVSAQMRYSKLGRTVRFTANIAITTNGTASGSVNMTLPFTNGPLGAICVGRESASTGKAVIGQIAANSSTGLTMGYYDNSYPGGTGTNIILSGCYEASS